jgi:hypothetical protein
MQRPLDGSVDSRELEEVGITMLDMIVFVSTVVFFVAAMLYVKLCDGLR